MPRVKIAFFAPDADKIPDNLNEEIGRVYNNKVELDFLFHCACMHERKSGAIERMTYFDGKKRGSLFVICVFRIALFRPFL